MIYLDSAATTPVSNDVMRAMQPYLQRDFGNPSSVHAQGQKAAAALMQARRHVAKCLGCNPDQVIFTSCGTEADNQAIFSLALAHMQKKKVITFGFEHAAVLQSVKRLQAFGFDVEILPVGSDGIVDVDDLKQHLDSDVCCVCMMMVNNEVGTIQPVSRVAKMCKERGILFHCDAVQAAGHMPIRFNEWGISTLAISAHKFHGPKGVGVLLHHPNDYVDSFIVGGGQERGLRSGTQNVAGIVGCAKALEQSYTHLDKDTRAIWKINDALREGLSRIPDARISGTCEKSNHVPGILHMCFRGIDAQTLLIYLDQHGICASAGSACMAGAVKKSGTLAAMGIDDVWAAGALRLSFDASITMNDVQRTIDVVTSGVAAQRNGK